MVAFHCLVLHIICCEHGLTETFLVMASSGRNLTNKPLSCIWATFRGRSGFRCRAIWLLFKWLAGSLIRGRFLHLRNTLIILMMLTWEHLIKIYCCASKKRLLKPLIVNYRLDYLSGICASLVRLPSFANINRCLNCTWLCALDKVLFNLSKLLLIFLLKPQQFHTEFFCLLLLNAFQLLNDLFKLCDFVFPDCQQIVKPSLFSL